MYLLEIPRGLNLVSYVDLQLRKGDRKHMSKNGNNTETEQILKLSYW